MRRSFDLRSFLQADRGIKPTTLRGFTDDNFVTEVLDAKELVVFDFWAGHWPLCEVMLRSMLQLRAEMPAVKFGRVDVTKNPEVVKAFELKAVPHLVVMLRGDVVLEVIGDKTCDELRGRIAPFVEIASRQPSADEGGDEAEGQHGEQQEC